MCIRHERYGEPKHIEGQIWQYWIDTYFAILPAICGHGAIPNFVWLRRYWVTYPVGEDGKVIEMYRNFFESDPRKKEKST